MAGRPSTVRVVVLRGDPPDNGPVRLAAEPPSERANRQPIFDRDGEPHDFYEARGQYLRQAGRGVVGAVRERLLSVVG